MMLPASQHLRPGGELRFGVFFSTTGWNDTYIYRPYIDTQTPSKPSYSQNYFSKPTCCQHTSEPGHAFVLCSSMPILYNKCVLYDRYVPAVVGFCPNTHEHAPHVRACNTHQGRRNPRAKQTRLYYTTLYQPSWPSAVNGVVLNTLLNYKLLT